MTTFDNCAPLDGWTVDPHGCPFELADCPICKGRATYADEPHLILGDN